MQENIIYGFSLGIGLVIIPGFAAWVINKLYNFIKGMLFDK